MDEKELLRRVTLAVRLADEEFERSGGSSRHWVSECFLPALKEEGLEIVDLPAPIGTAVPLEFLAD